MQPVGGTVDTLTIEHQDGDLVYSLDRGGYAVQAGTVTVSVETVPLTEDQFPDRALFSLVDAPLTGELRVGLVFEARSIAGETVEGGGAANAYFGFHADDIALRLTVKEVTPNHAVFALEAEHDDVNYYGARARRTTTTGLFTLASVPRDQLWTPI
jgi:hypothetical protein